MSRFYLLVLPVPRRFRLRWLAFFLTLFSTAAAFPATNPPAAPKAAPDVIIFKNGDQLTGKLVRADGANVFFHSDMAGDITASWDKVKELHSNGEFALLQKGVSVHRKSAKASIPQGKLDIHDATVQIVAPTSPTPPVPIKNLDIVVDEDTFNKQLRSEPSFFQAWSGIAKAGASLVQATQNSTVFNGSVNLARVFPTVSWLIPKNRTTADFTGSYGRITQTGVPTVKTSIYHADAERDEYFTPRLFVLAQTAFDHNFSQGLDLQQIYGGGIGWTILKTPKRQLDLKGTVQYEKQQFLASAGTANQDLFGSTFSANYVIHLPKRMVFTQQVSYIPAWNVSRAYSVNETGSFVLPVYKNLGVTLGTIDTYLNDPPLTVPPTKRNSFQFTTGVSYSFKEAY